MSDNTKLIFPNTKEWDDTNNRRAVLIHKKNREGLTPDEEIEFNNLQNAIRATLNSLFKKI